MPRNTFFQFKQFRIEQANTAMKVCTDACILGSYAGISGANTILDIGTGTGVLALMLAQRCPNAVIHAVEIEQKAFIEAKQNIESSIFSHQIKIFHQSIQAFDVGIKYDLIVSNPPFFQQHLLSPTTERNMALHTQWLSFDDLLDKILVLLQSSGSFVVLLPPYETHVFRQKAQRRMLFVSDSLMLQNTENARPFRIISTFQYTPASEKNNSLIIKDNSNNYTAAFCNLLHGFYLNI